MTRSHAILVGPFLVALLATAFCVWTALGNDVNICVTTGCTLYQDFSIAGVSLWWYGTGAFTVLAACALLGQGQAGRFLSALFLLGDSCLLLLMSLTAPCVNCLVAAFLFALSYYLFRLSSPQASAGQKQQKLWRPSFLMLFWGIFFVINLGLVVRSQLDVWPILDESGDARVRMFFSPSCSHCADSINVLSGNINMGFYPVADSDADVFRLAKMIDYLNEGMNLAEALGQSSDVEPGGFFSSLSPRMMLLRFRLLRNKAHVFAAGSEGVPFFEYRGTPPGILQAEKSRGRDIANAVEESSGRTSASTGPKDATLPLDLGDSGQCIAGKPCPPVQ